MTIVDRKIYYADEWYWDTEKEIYINECTKETLTEDEFESQYIVG